MKTLIATAALLATAATAFAQAPKVPTGIDVQGPAWYHIPAGTTRVVTRKEPCGPAQFRVRDPLCPITDNGDHAAADAAKDAADAAKK